MQSYDRRYYSLLHVLYIIVGSMLPLSISSPAISNATGLDNKARQVNKSQTQQHSCIIRIFEILWHGCVVSLSRAVGDVMSVVHMSILNTVSLYNSTYFHLQLMTDADNSCQATTYDTATAHWSGWSSLRIITLLTFRFYECDNINIYVHIYKQKISEHNLETCRRHRS